MAVAVAVAVAAEPGAPQWRRAEASASLVHDQGILVVYAHTHDAGAGAGVGAGAGDDTQSRLELTWRLQLPVSRHRRQAIGPRLRTQRQRFGGNPRVDADLQPEANAR